LKRDVCSFARIVGRIAADDLHRGVVGLLVAKLIKDGLSQDPSNRPSLGALVARLEATDFKIVEGIDSAAVSAFVRAVGAAKP
jgi:hypothetical protein